MSRYPVIIKVETKKSVSLKDIDNDSSSIEYIRLFDYSFKFEIPSILNFKTRTLFFSSNYFTLFNIEDLLTRLNPITPMGCLVLYEFNIVFTSFFLAYNSSSFNSLPNINFL